MTAGTRTYLQHFIRSAHTSLHFGLLKNVLHSIRSERVVHRDNANVVSVASLFGNTPLKAVLGVNAQTSKL